MAEKLKGKLCKCGHDHISYVGDLGKNQDEAGWDRIIECEKCNCESFEAKKKMREYDVVYRYGEQERVEIIIADNAKDAVRILKWRRPTAYSVYAYWKK